MVFPIQKLFLILGLAAAPINRRRRVRMDTPRVQIVDWAEDWLHRVPSRTYDERTAYISALSGANVEEWKIQMVEALFFPDPT